MIFDWFGRPRRVAQQACSVADEAVRSMQRAVEAAQNANDAAERALALVDGLQSQLALVRDELTAYRLGTMEEDAQTAELERMVTL